jgi:hypothetical protein
MLRLPKTGRISIPQALSLSINFSSLENLLYYALFNPIERTVCQKIPASMFGPGTIIWSRAEVDSPAAEPLSSKNPQSGRT